LPVVPTARYVDLVSNRILLVDDEPLLRRAFRTLLETAGHEVSEAGTAAEALEAARTGKPELVFLDLGLPDGSGLDVARTLTAESQARVVALTGRNDQGIGAACREAGCVAHLVKPVSPRDLLRGVPGWIGAVTDAPAETPGYSGRRTPTTP
jgi:CheY-like chemotaxis protein